MSIAPRVTALLLAVASVAVLGGCVGGTPVESASPSPSATPVFATEEEALAAAEATYQGFSIVSDTIGAQGGRDADRITPFLTADYAPTEVSGFEELAESGMHIQGATRFDSLKIQDPGSFFAGDSFTSYLCLDVSDVRVIDKDDMDVTPADRQTRLPLQVAFEIVSGGPWQVLIDGSETWTGENFC